MTFMLVITTVVPLVRWPCKHQQAELQLVDEKRHHLNELGFPPVKIQLGLELSGGLVAINFIVPYMNHHPN